MNGPIEEKADCYSAGERGAMVWFQQLRAVCLGPLLRLLVALKIHPDHVTLASLAAGLTFCPLYNYSPLAAVLALALHVLLDGLDGPLARFAGVASRRGSFTDSMADQVVVVASTISLMAAKDLDLVAGSLYIFVYTLVVGFAMVRNAMRVPYSWVVRPRFIVYAWIAVQLWWLPGSLTTVVWICNALLSWKVLTGFWKIRRSISPSRPSA